LLAKINVAPKIKKKVTKEFFGPSPSIFVGRIGYPDVNIGPLGVIDNVDIADEPKKWFGMGYSKIIEMRSLVLRSKRRENVTSRSKFIETMQEIVMSTTPVDVELKFKKKPVYVVSFSDTTQPMGPVAPIKRLKLAGNPKIPLIVEKVAGDEIAASKACAYLYSKNVDVYKIATIFSSGALGLKENKKLVPTRYSITAIDDIIAKELLKRVRMYRQIDKYMVYESEYLSNHFVILLIPGHWEFENFEAWAPGSFWSQNLKSTEILVEYEPFKGRSKYAELEGGGYYASRLGVVEALHRMRRQARVVVFREVYEGYMIPLGVWVVRETVRNAFKNKPMVFETQEEALKYIGKRNRIPLTEYIKRSRILKQKRIEWFIH